MTVNSRNCTRSKVVKRKLQAMQTRRRRITAESSVGRESFTCVSRLLQLGHRIPNDLYGVTLLIDRETVGERPHPFLDRGLGQWCCAIRRLRNRVEHFGD